MNHPITTTLSDNIYQFLELETKNNGVTKKSIIETALKMYKKNKLKNEIIKGLKERQDEYCEINKEFENIQFNSINYEN